MISDIFFKSERRRIYDFGYEFVILDNRFAPTSIFFARVTIFYFSSDKLNRVNVRNYSAIHENHKYCRKNDVKTGTNHRRRNKKHGIYGVRICFSWFEGGFADENYRGKNEKYGSYLILYGSNNAKHGSYHIKHGSYRTKHGSNHRYTWFEPYKTWFEPYKTWFEPYKTWFEPYKIWFEPYKTWFEPYKTWFEP